MNRTKTFQFLQKRVAQCKHWLFLVAGDALQQPAVCAGCCNPITQCKRSLSVCSKILKNSFLKTVKTLNRCRSKKFIFFKYEFYCVG